MRECTPTDVSIYPAVCIKSEEQNFLQAWQRTLTAAGSNEGHVWHNAFHDSGCKYGIAHSQLLSA